MSRTRDMEVVITPDGRVIVNRCGWNGVNKAFLKLLEDAFGKNEYLESFMAGKHVPETENGDTYCG
jgi:hypothetical protein